MKKRMKWEPAAAMVAVLVVGMLLVIRPGDLRAYDLRPGATTHELRAVHSRGKVETVVDPMTGRATFRLLTKDGHASPVLDEEQFKSLLGPAAFADAMNSRANWVFRLFNITTWASLVWIAVGFAGQIAFSGRMLVQWFLSEKRGQSVVPEVFWWLSLLGGAMLFAYFVWRQDPVGVLGQTSGLVIYARNLRLIGKHKRRAARAGQAAESAG